MPVTSFSMVLPPGTKPVLQIQSSRKTVLNQITIPLFPDSIVSLSSAANNERVFMKSRRKLFGVPIVTFEVQPLFYNRKARALQLLEELTIDIQVDGGHPLSIPIDRPLSAFQKQALKAEVLNASDVRFRVKPKPLAHSKRDWYDPTKSYVKFYIAQQGLYKIAYRALVDSLGLPAGLNPAQFQLLYKGKEIPLALHVQDSTRFQPGDYFVFYGDWNRGTDEFYNLYSDTSVYWFSYQGTGGKRLRFRKGVPGADSLVSYFWKRAHFEEDHYYYFGDNDLYIFSSDRSPGEGWIWERIYAGDTFTTTVRTNNLTRGDGPDSLVIRLRGMTSDVPNPDHHIRVYLNGTLLGDVAFDGLKQVIFRAAIPDGLLKEGSNSVRIESVGDTGASRDAVYLDWIELGYFKSYVASDNFLLANSPRGVRGKRISYQVTNFHDQNIWVYDVSDTVLIDSVQVEAYENGKYYARFSDSITCPKTYVITTATALLTPARIVRDVPSDLKNPANSADYLIVTARPFQKAAEELAAYRAQANGFRTRVVDVQDIYDQFSYGIFSPPAIRKFLKFTAENWQPPAPSYVLFFGDGTWDYKHHLKNSREKNFVPPIANPVSDNRYVAFDDTDPYVPQMFAGRLPVKTPEQAADVVEKIKQYADEPPALWKKQVTFLNGGVNDWEQNMFKAESEALIRHFVEKPPFGGVAHRIYKQSKGRLVGELRPEIMQALDNGCLWFNFMGHAGSDTWDLMIQNEDIPQLTNGNKLPFITSMTCHTARFANPFLDSFAEVFVTMAGRGAVAFWGTTGWGYIYQDNFLLNRLFKHVLHDTLLDLGQATTLARVDLWRELGDAPTNRSALDQYTLIGDPALHLNLPKKPDVAISPASLTLKPEEVTQRDSVLTVRIALENLGLFEPDSVPVRVEMETETAQLVSAKNSWAPPFGTVDTLQVPLPLSRQPGNFILRVTLDPNTQLDEFSRTNNTAEITFSVYSTEISISFPPPFSLLPETQPQLRLLVPEELPTDEAVRYDFELDTSADFRSADKISASHLEGGPLVASWRVPVALRNGLYFWRARMWTGEHSSDWVRGLFQVRSGDSSFGWGQSARTGFAGALLKNLTLTGGAFELAGDPSRAVYLEVQSAGHDDGNRAYLIVNFKVVNQHTRGINVVALDGKSGELLAPAHVYDTFASEASADSLADFIQNLPAGSVVLAGIMDDGSFHLTEKAYKALESIGSRFCRRIGFRDSWAIIGRKGAPVGTVPEKWVPVGGGYAIVRDTLLTYRMPRGSLTSPAIGPAKSWKTAEIYGGTGGPGVVFSTSVWGQRRGSTQWDSLFSAPFTGAPLSLAKISAVRYPYLRLKVHFGSLDGHRSPHLSEWHVRYTPPCDLVSRASLFSVEPDTVLEGTPVQISGPVFNIGPESSDSVAVTLLVLNNEGRPDTVAFSVLPPLHPDESDGFRATIPTAGLRGRRTAVVVLDPKNRQNELSEENNRLVLHFFVRTDTTRPLVRVQIDGREILPGDLVSKQPTIEIDVADNSFLALDDTALVTIFLDEQRQRYKENSSVLTFQSVTKADGSAARVVFTPTLDDGFHTLDVVAKDATRNLRTAHLEFRVISTFKIRDLLNFPNPTAGATDFTFTLTQPAEEVSLNIFTLSGRRIFRATDLPGEAGTNLFHWDGRDADGDPLANGVYLYKLTARRSGKTVSALGKLVVLR